MIEEQEGMDQALESTAQGLDPIRKEAQKEALYVISHHQLKISEKISTVESPCGMSCGFHWLSIAREALMVADKINSTRSTIRTNLPAEMHNFDLHFTIANK